MQTTARPRSAGSSNAIRTLASWPRIAPGEIIGAILSGHDGRRSRIYHTAVSPDARGMGVGSLLVGHVIEALRTLGLPKVAVGVYADNEAGNKFWERQGFQVRDDLVYRELPL